MRKGERRAGSGTGSAEESLREERNTNVKCKNRVHISEWNACKKCQYAISQPPQVTELKCLGSTLSQWRHEYISEQEDKVWVKQLEEDVGVPYAT